ncbi:hypothetical protein QBC41DRAFT_367684 [Cercophora samala]|uniref:DUF7580 domain-containing protein n=1 Tax=Cercophora samala TaxID=330535 RepID=A0AA40D9A4_9PEZI|nr:hypothetical protein QBC41DRAFT_367684 [Cercophora samala]
MSGLEIAGAVLGSIPILISALERYGDAASAFRRQRKYKSELDYLKRNLQTERVKLQNVLEKLINGLVSSAQLEAMIKDPDGNEWKTESIQRKVKARLCESYEPFERNVEGVNLALQEMEQKLGTQNDGKVSEFRRGIFTLKRAAFDDLLKKIREGVSNLEKLTDQGIDLEPSRRVRSQGKLLQILRNLSNSLYRALQLSLPCGCQHDLGMKLERRAFDIALEHDEEKMICEWTFNLAVSSMSRPGTTVQDQKAMPAWQKVLVKPTPSPPPTTLSSRSPTSDIHPLIPQTSAAASPTARLKGKKTVTFRFSPLVSTSTVTTVVETQPQKTISTAISDLTNIMTAPLLSRITTTINLCESFQKLQQSCAVQDRSPYGVIIDQQALSMGRQYTVYPSEPTSTWSLISLREILEQKDSYLPMSYRDRLHLALVISSNVLQLHGTPWAPDTLDSHNVFFLARNGYPLYSHPLFLNTHSPSTKPASSPSASDSGIAFVFDREPKLLTLGFLLIELMLGQTLESLRGETGSGIFPEGSLVWKYVIAHNALPRVRTESLNYWTAVRRCMDGDLHTRGSGTDGTGLDSVSLCEEVYSGIVALLEKDYENCC